MSCRRRRRRRRRRYRVVGEDRSIIRLECPRDEACLQRSAEVWAISELYNSALCSTVRYCPSERMLQLRQC